MKRAPVSVTPRWDALIRHVGAVPKGVSDMIELTHEMETENTALHKRVATLRRTIARATDEVATLKRLFKLARSVKRRSVSVSCPSRTGLQWSDHETGPVTRRG